jgi:hypothetical protein
MKFFYTLLYILLPITLLQAAVSPAPFLDKPARIADVKPGSQQQVQEHFRTMTRKISGATDSAFMVETSRIQLIRYQQQEYTVRAPIWQPATQVLGINLLFMGFNRYVAKAEYGYVSFDTWKHNLKTGPEWDTDQFGINFIGHPFQGTLYFNAARSHGYSYWQSLPFAVDGSLTWEYFGENTLPSYNDMIYTLSSPDIG